ncbi:DUF2809 domain-containing protein [Myxococcota bacterium]|nr:DUF2809 domain-containing protein [Myxococcota bacterium]MBU1431212.1 DUF2809 domain-containing protein [Myxococcota bacterium]MBU1896797.1 DUF2809 domain-containing protein [Myxococcota bacterium]
MKVRLHPRALGVALGILLIEILIACFARDRLLRPFIGDVLAVIWVFSLAMAFIEAPPRLLALGAWAFACLVEITQYFQLVEHLGLSTHRWARITLGMVFDPLDLLAYTLGALIAWALTRQTQPLKTKKREDNNVETGSI